MNKKIKIYRTPMGDIIGNEIKKENEVYFLEDVLSVQVDKQQGADGTVTGVSVGFGSVAPFSKGATDKSPQINIEMPYTNVLFAYDPSDDLAEGYLDVVDPKLIITPSTKINTI